MQERKTVSKLTAGSTTSTTGSFTVGVAAMVGQCPMSICIELRCIASRQLAPNVKDLFFAVR